ncbi:MAG TPA: DUF6252 family protein [Cytophagaceae bacterium]
MKNQIFKICLIFVLVQVFGCKSDNDPAPSVDNTIEPGYLYFHRDGEQYKDTLNIFIDKVNNKITISSTEHVLPSQFNKFNVTINGTEVGKYVSNASQSENQVKYIYNNVEYLSTNSSAGVVINITKIDTVNWKISGDFSGELTDANGNSIQLTSGAFLDILYLEPRGGDGSPDIDNEFTAEMNEETFTGTSVQASASAGIIKVSANKDQATLSLTFPVSAPGTYSITPDSAYKAYYRNNGTEHIAQYGQITITSHDYANNIVHASFNFTTSDGTEIKNGTLAIVY